ncbi:hypothetical protein P3523_21135 [Vibrio parahaemolyticus]|nr:hypothetical protein [Vibrio parahaemolyticus]
MFEIGKRYELDEIKAKLGVKNGGSILKKGNDFVALTMGSKSFLEPNLFLVGSGSLIRKVGRALASEKKPIYIFFQNKYKGQACIDKTATAPKAIKSKLAPYPHLNPKDYSRMVFLKFKDSNSEGE